MEALLADHRREKKETQARIQALKNSVPKGDKRKKKEIQEIIDQFEKQLADKHKAELAALQPEGSTAQVEEDVQEKEEKEEVSPKKKVNRQEQRKLRKAQAAKEQREAVERELANAPDPKEVELKTLLAKLEPEELSIKEVRADGHCLFAAVAFLLSSHWVAEEQRPPIDEIWALRAQVVTYIEAHKEETLPFLVDDKTGDMMTEDGFTTYCREMRTKPVWGGAPEVPRFPECVVMRN